MLFVQSGSVEVSIDGEKRTLGAGDACFIDGFSVHAYAEACGNNYVMVAHKEYLSAFLHKSNGKTLPTFFRFEEFEVLETLFLFCDKRKNERGGDLIFAGALDILLGCISERTPLIKKEENKQASFVCEVLRYAENNATADLSVKAVSKLFAYSPDHFSRMMRKYLNESWNTYVNRIRLQCAMKLMNEDKNRSVLSAALESGFESACTFYRAYKKQFGTLPKRNA